MSPSFIAWIKQVGYFPYFLLADISILAMSVGLSLFFLSSLDAFLIFSIYLLVTCAEYGLMYCIYKQKHPTPSGVFFLGNPKDVFVSREDFNDHTEGFGRTKKGACRLNEN